MRTIRASRAWLAIISSVVAAALLPPSVQAHPDSTDTLIFETFANAPTDISPGLCAPGDTPDCVGPEVAEFRVLSTACVMNGLFEGEELPLNAPCGFELYGFLTGIEPGSKPACGAARFVTSDHTTAFGDNKTSKLVINGVPRSIYIDGVSVGLLNVFTTVQWDDDDEDSDPTGDHIAIAPPALVLRQSGGSGTPCVNQPLTQGIMPAGSAIEM
jgi:hypothetical protein